jgi:hypothetical protein
MQLKTLKHATADANPNGYIQRTQYTLIMAQMAEHAPVGHVQQARAAGLQQAKHGPRCNQIIN